MKGRKTVQYSDEFEPEEERPEKKNSTGFYVVLVICLLAVCGVAVATFFTGDTGVPKDPTVPSVTTVGTIRTTVTTEKAAAVTVTGVTETTTTTVTTKKSSVTTTTVADLFVLPVGNRVLRPYSDTLEYSEVLGSWTTHNGIDFGADNGAPVKAAADGKIAAVYEDALWGASVEVDHGNHIMTRYHGVSATAGLSVGKTVKAGDVIGTVCAIPAETDESAHLHLEVIVNGHCMDPLTLIRSAVVTMSKTTTAS